MKDQIHSVMLQTDAAEGKPAEWLILQDRTICRRMADTESETIVMEEAAADELLNALLKLLGDRPQPDAGSYRNTLMLKDGTKYTLPRTELEQLMLTAWEDAKDYQRMLEEMFREPQMMGAVASPTITPNPAFMGMNAPQPSGFMGMYNPPAPPKPVQKSVRIDRETWDCGCGQTGLHTKFCPECGYPAPPQVWDCPNCGAKNLTSKFCPSCGTPAKE